MEKERNNYSFILKAIGLFGGVKVFQIIVNIIRSKIIAILIGPSGMGIIGLFQSSIEVVNQFTGCGLQTSSVRDISRSVSEGDDHQLGVVVSTLKRLVWLTGLLGMIVVFLFSDYLSFFAFGSDSHSLDFKYLSIILVLTQLNIGQIALLQGTFRYREMAKASLFGSLVSLIVVCPFYYFYKQQGIVPSLIAAAIINLLFSWIYSRRVPYKKVVLSFYSFLSNSKGMITLGAAMSIGMALSTASGYLMNLFLTTQGDVAIVGLYQAANQVANSYVLLVFSSMVSDYMPRLAALNNDSEAQIEAINMQAILVIIILAPLLSLMMVFSKEVILLLYSSEFSSISLLITIFMSGMLFRAISWCLSYSLIARGEAKSFLICESISCTASLALMVCGYLISGFIGMGVGFVINYILYSFILLVVSKKSFGFAFSTELKRLFIKAQGLVFACLLTCVLPIPIIAKYILGVGVILIVSLSSVKELKKRINLNGIFKKIIAR